MNNEQTTIGANAVAAQFQHVNFDAEVMQSYNKLQASYVELAKAIDTYVPYAGAKAMILNKLQESFMWTGVAFKDITLSKSGLSVAEKTAA